MTLTRGARPPGQIGCVDVCQPKAFGDRACGKAWVPDGRQRRKHDASGVVARERMRQFEGQASLPDSSRTEQRDEAVTGVGEPLEQQLQIALATQKRSYRLRQWRSAELIDGRVTHRHSRACQQLVADTVVILGSVDIVLGEVDR